MAINVVENLRQDQYTVSSVTQLEYDYTFPIFDEGDLSVTLNDTVLVVNTDYTVTGVGIETGGTIVLINAPVMGDVITILGETPIERVDQNFQQAGDFQSDDLNRQLNILTVQNQEQQRDIDRTFRAPVTGDGIDTELPAPQANFALVWNADANALTNSDTAFNDVVPLAEQYRDEAQASAESASASANEASISADIAVEAAGSVSNAPFDSFTGDGLQTEFNLTPSGFTSDNENAYIVFVDSNPMRPGVDFDVYKDIDENVILRFLAFAPQARVDNIQVYGRNSTLIERPSESSVDSVNGQTGTVELTASDIVQNAIVGVETIEEALEVIKDTFDNLDYVISVQGGTNISIDNTDMQNPIVNLNGNFVQAVTTSGTRLSNTGTAEIPNINIADIANLAIESFDTITVSDNPDNASFITGMQLSNESNGFAITDINEGVIQNTSGRELKLLGSVEMHPDKTGGGTEALRLYSEISSDGVVWTVNPNSLRITEVDGNSESYISYCSDIVFPTGSYVRFRLFCGDSDEVDITSLQETVSNGQTVICPSFKWRLGELD